MKRSAGRPLGNCGNISGSGCGSGGGGGVSGTGAGAAKRFEKMQSSPQLVSKQQIHHQHQQPPTHPLPQHHNVISPLNQSYLPVHTPTSVAATAAAAMGMMRYTRPPPPPSLPPTSFMYNHAGVAIPPTLWNYSVPPPPPPSNIVPQLSRPPPPLHSLGTPPQMLSVENHTINNNIIGNKLMRRNTRTGSRTVVTMKPKRKSMSSRYGCAKGWVREDAIKAISLEEECSQRGSKAPILLLRFPDPDLNRDIISKYSPDIESVHFQQNSAPRYCFVHLKRDADVEKAIETISKVPFGSGFISAELKRLPVTVSTPTEPEEVDPYTLYIGNLPTSITADEVKVHFPGAQRIDIGFAQRMKYTRYAFVRYDNVEKAMEAFKQSASMLIGTRSLIVRFRRQRSTVASGEPVAPKKTSAKSVQNMDILARNDDVDTQMEDKAATATAATAAAAAAATVTATKRKVTAKHTDQTQKSDADKQSGGSHILGTAFDSPSSIEETEALEIDSKDKVLQDAQMLRKKLIEEQQAQLARQEHNQSSAGHQRRSSLEEMFSELEQRDVALSNMCVTKRTAQQLFTADVRIKEEKDLYDDDLSEEDDMPNLLGARYLNDTDIKTEVEDDVGVEQSHDDMYTEDFEYDDEFDMEPEETDDEQYMTEPSTSKFCDVKTRTTLEATEEKPNVNELQASVMARLNTTVSPVNEQTSFIRELHEQIRRAKYNEAVRRPRDDLDELFAQMNSDDEDEYDDFL